MLESSCHGHSAFVTLTYDTEPKGNTLVKHHLSTTMHRLRERIRVLDRQIRFYGIGEYGEVGARPHYHAAIFGFGPDDHHLLKECWDGIHRSHIPAVPGFVHIGDLTTDSASYLTGYLSKKLTKPEDPRLEGREPEFSLMSRNPGIGSVSLPGLIEALNSSDGALYMARHKDVPMALRIGGKLLPLGPYIRGKLRMFFFGEETQPQVAKDLHEATFKAEVLHSLPLDASALDRINIQEPETRLKVFEAQANYIKQKEITRKVRTRQITTRHKINLSRKML